MNLKEKRKTAALIAICAWLGLSFSLPVVAGCEWAGPGNKGWRCKKSADCKGKLRCRSYYWPSKKKLIRLCATHRARLTNKDVYNWAHIIMFWGFCIGFPLAIVIFVIWARMKQKRESGKGAPGGPQAAGPGQGPPGPPEGPPPGDTGQAPTGPPGGPA